MPRRLPPLPALRFFEAAGRLCSFKLAAAELNVTPSAVSHGIVGLEQALGVDLFVRGPRGLSLTPEGADYLLYVSEALSLIATATQRLPAARGGRGIAISCAPTLASRWLLPRLHSFRAQWPDVQIAIDTSQRHVGFPVDGFDFAIRMSRGPVSAATWARLFGETLVPVCSAAYRDTLADEQGRIDLARATLIHVDLASEDWQAWLERVDDPALNRVELAGGLRFDTIQLAFEAAAAGLGVVLGRRPLVDRDLAAGTLVALALPVLQAETAYWLVSSDGVPRRSELLAFRQWLLSE
ncbi:MAG TPA: LysR substrate-binding domain-containing protein [Bordetella sp.]|nr:LysR substrate-binding domain-containing protein [Bordetella sp.]